MTKYSVLIAYELVIFADDENQAAIIAQTDLSSCITHPQTGDVVGADIRVEKATQPAPDIAAERTATLSCPQCGKLVETVLRISLR